jgi:hypothetical protein
MLVITVIKCLITEGTIKAVWIWISAYRRRDLLDFRESIYFLSCCHCPVRNIFFKGRRTDGVGRRLGDESVEDLKGAAKTFVYLGNCFCCILEGSLWPDRLKLQVTVKCLFGRIPIPATWIEVDRLITLSGADVVFKSNSYFRPQKNCHFKHMQIFKNHFKTL